MNYEDRVTKGAVEGLIAGCAKIEAGTYVGTGTYGAENPTSLTFPFEPKLVLVAHAASNSTWFLWIQGCAESKWGDAACFEAVTASGNGISWYACSGNADYRNATYQCNKNGETYRYLAVG